MSECVSRCINLGVAMVNFNVEDLVTCIDIYTYDLILRDPQINGRINAQPTELQVATNEFNEMIIARNFIIKKMITKTRNE